MSKRKGLYANINARKKERVLVDLKVNLQYLKKRIET